MKASTKLIIAAAVLIAGGGVGYYFWNKKKKGESAPSAPAEEKPVASPSTSTGTKPVTSSGTPLQGGTIPVPTGNIPKPVGSVIPFTNVIDINGKAVLQGLMVPNGTFKAGDKVRVTGKYAGDHVLYYVYTGVQSGQPVQNLYLPVAFAGIDSGTVVKVA
jgi:hypothetical protein